MTCDPPSPKVCDERSATQTRRRPIFGFRLLLASLGLLLVSAPGLARALTLAPGDLLVSATLRVDPVNGVQARIQIQWRFSIFDLDPDGRPIAFVPPGSPSPFMTDVGLIVRLDPGTGELTPLLGSGDLYVVPSSMAVDGAGDIFVVMSGRLFRAQPDDGTVRPVGSAQGSAYGYMLQQIAIGPDGGLYGLMYALAGAYDPRTAVVRIDPVTGEQTIISSNGEFVRPAAVDVTPDGRILVVDRGTNLVSDPLPGGMVFEIDPATGAQTMVASGGGLQVPTDIGIGADGRTYLMDPYYRTSPYELPANGAVYTVDWPAGTPTRVSAGGELDLGGNLAVVRPYDAPRGMVPRPEDLCLVPGFAPPIHTPTELSPTDLATVDLNQDGAPDVVATNFFSNTVSVLLGNGDGTLAPQVSYPTGGIYPEALAVGDLNGDLASDIVVTNFSSVSVAVFLNHGDGTFAPAELYPAGINPTSVAIGDLDNDGASDLVVANNYSRDVTLLFGAGDGTFARRGGDLPMGGLAADAVALGDLNHDEKLDLVVGNGVAGIAVLIGGGDGTFGPRATYAAGYRANDVVVADLDGDGHLDVAEADLSWETGVYVLPGSGDGRLGNPVLIPTGRDPSGIAVADFNRDGRPDLAVANRMAENSRIPNDGYVTVLTNYREGKFTRSSEIPMHTNPTAVAATDLDGDGGADLIAANLNSWDISVRRGASTMSVSPRRLPFPEQPLGATGAPGRITVKSCGPAPLEVAGATLTGSEAGAFSIVQDECSGRRFEPGESCEMGVTFTPQANGWASATLDVETDAAVGPHAVNLRGTAPNADLEVELASTQPAYRRNAEAVFTLSLRNSGPTPARDVVAVFLPPGKSKPRSMLASRGSCAIPKSSLKPPPAVCEFGDMEAGGHATVRFTMNLKAPLYTPVQVVTAVGTSTFDPDESNNVDDLFVYAFNKP